MRPMLHCTAERRTAAWRAIFAAACLVALGGCSSGMVPDLPTWAGGLPPNAPERPAETAAFPAVHDMPPARTTAILSDEEQERLARDLAAARERNARAGGQR